MSDELKRLIEKSLQIPMTEEELREQRRSFVRAEAGFGSDRDEAAYRAAIATGDSAAIARLDAEAEARMAAVDEVLRRNGQ